MFGANIKKSTLPVCIHLIDSLSNGGAENILVNSVNELSEFTNIVLYLEGSGEMKERFINADVICLNVYSKFYYPFLVWRIRSIIKKKKATVVHSHSFWTNILCRLATPRKVKLFNSYHFADYATRSDLFKVKRMIFLDKLTMRQDLNIIAVSDFLGKAIRLKLRYKYRIHTLYNFIGDEYIGLPKALNWEKNTKLRVIVIGNIKSEKNYELLIQVCTELKYENFIIDVYGGGNLLNYFRAEVNRLGLNNICFKGSSERISSILSNYHLYIMCSISEALPLSPIQAMAVDLPMLLSDIDALREVAENKAIFFESNNSIDFALKLKLILSKETSINIQDEYYKTLLSKYNKSRFLETLRYLYSGALDKN